MDPRILWHAQDHYVSMLRKEDLNDLPYLVVKISDNGVGIPQTMVPKVFQPFVGTSKEGTGLGLYISARLIALHRGMIGFLTKEREGTIFYVLLPEKG
jgi:signal transduction histidine kinase